MDCLNDNTIGPAVKGCRGDFDFTVTFQQIFCSLVPAGVFITLSIARIAYLLGKERIVRGRSIQFAKLVAIAAHVSLQLALLIVSAKLGDGQLSIASRAITLIASMALLPLSFVEHSRTPRPSVLLEVYLFSTLLLDIAQTRTWWLVAGSKSSRASFASVLTAVAATKVVIILMEALPKSRWMGWNAKDHSPEETTGVWGLSVYSWLNRLFGQGYREVLAISNLYPLDADMRAKVLYPKLQRQLETMKYKGKRLGLARALVRAIAVPLLLPMAPRLALLGFTYSQPFFVKAVLEHLQSPDDGTKRRKGYGLIGAAVLIYGGIAISDSLHQYFMQRALYMARGCLCSAIYRKTTQAKDTAADDKAALTLMSTDVEKIVTGFRTLHDWWAGIIAVGLGCWLLQRQLGTAFAAPVVTVVVCAAITSFVSTFIAKSQAAWMAQIQKRVGLTANSIANMKGYKISGLVEPVVKQIQALRMTEIHAGNRFRSIVMISAVLAHAPQTLGPLFTFAVASKQLDTTAVYTSMSYILLLTNPLIFLLQTISAIVAAFTCMARIQKFLDDDPRHDFRKFVASFAEGNENEEPSRRKSRQGEKGHVAIRVSNGVFGYSRDKMVLKDINISVPAAALTLVVGPVASGKTTLCKALLGEIAVAEGEVAVSGFPKRTAYCDQTPFLLNATLAENIIGHEAFDQTRYGAVVSACQLEADIALFPNGHETRIGSNGIVLSGGQRQRVALARALYLPECPLLIFDDILSGLDNDTAAEVYRRVFGPSGLIRQRSATAVLCTHSVRHLPTADHIVALSDGRVVEEGSFDDLMMNASYVTSLGIKSGEAHETSEGSSPEVVKQKTALQPRSTTEALSNTLDKARQMGDWKTYRLYFRLINPFLTATIVIVGALYGFGDNFGNIWLGLWTNNRYSRTNAFYLGIYGLLKCTQLLSIAFVGLAICVTVVTAVGGKLHKTALDTVAKAPLRFFTSTDSGVVTNLFSQDLTLVDGELQITKVNLALMLFDILGMAGVIAAASPYLCASYPGLVLVLYMIQKFYLRTSRQMRLLDLEAKSPLYTHFFDTIRGVATLRAFGWTLKDVEKNERLLDTSQRPAYLLVMIQQWLGLVLHLVVLGLATVLVSLATQLSTSAGFTGASLVTLIHFGEALSVTIQCYTQLETSIGAVARLNAFSEQVAPEDLEGEDCVPPSNWPDRGRISISRLSASYSSNDEDDNASEKVDQASNMTLRDISLEIQPGEKVALCGRTGSGKSTLMLVLLRLLDPLSSNGEQIHIDGLPLHQLDRTALRRRIIAIPQDAVFLPDGCTVKENLDPFEEASEEECVEVLGKVQLGPFVQEHGISNGMSADTLSAGQKQLFSLGRAILRRRLRDKKFQADQPGGVLLLDEVSSNVDKDTDRIMQEIIKDEFLHYTIIMISHRLDMVVDFFTTVVVLDKGTIVEMGTPRHLIEAEGSRFGEFWRMGIQHYGKTSQAGGEES